jgi:hypothetical protein
MNYRYMLTHFLVPRVSELRLYLQGYKAKHQMELNVIAILFIIWTLPSTILAGAMILCILVSAVFGEVLLAARYISSSVSL